MSTGPNYRRGHGRFQDGGKRRVPRHYQPHRRLTGTGRIWRWFPTTAPAPPIEPWWRQQEWDVQEPGS